MRRFSFLLPLLVMAVSACAPKVSETTIIQGRIEGGTADKITITVQDYDIFGEPVEIVDGTFRYELATNPAIVATVACYMGNYPVSQQPLIPDGSELALVFSPDEATLTSSNKKSVNYRFLELLRVEEEQNDIATKYVTLRQTGAPKEQIDSLVSLGGPISERLQVMYREYLEQEKDNYLFVEGLSNLGDQIPDEQKDSLINTLDSAVIKTARIQNMQKDIQARLRSKEGMPFLDFTVVQDPADPETTTVKFSDYIGKGKYVLVDFWASWCGPCRAEMPNLVDVYNTYRGEDFDMLSVAVWEDASPSLKAAPGLGIVWDQIVNAQSIPTDLYGINGIPHVILFGPDGTILRRNLYGVKIAQTVKEYLGR